MRQLKSLPRIFSEAMISFVILSCIFAGLTPAWSTSMPRGQNELVIKKEKKEIASIIQILNSCPSWLDGTTSEHADKSNLLCMRRISRYNNRVIRYAVVHYLQGTSENPWKVAKIYLLIRYIYNVPERLPFSEKIALSSDFLNFERYDQRWFYTMWPLYLNSHGKIALLTYPGGIETDGLIGVPSLELLGFDYACRHFGRRPLRELDD